METETKDNNEAKSPTPPKEGGGGGKLTSKTFDLQHKVFSIEGGYFSQSQDKSLPVFFVPLGGTFGAVPLNTLRKTFDIEPDSHDDHLLGVVEASLRFCKEIRPGESIPKELLDGSASWSVKDEHRVLARNRMIIQLASWGSGHEIVVSDASQIEQIVEDPSTQQRLDDAYNQLTKKLGLPLERRNEVENRVAAFAHELAYIEALRERYGDIRMIVEKVDRLRGAYKLDRTFAAEIMQMQKLFRTPIGEFQTIFDQVDAQSGEVVALLKNLDTQIAFTRRMRDDLHCRMMDWEELIQKWQDIVIERTTANENMVKQTYRFLAQRYLKTNVWKRE